MTEQWKPVVGFEGRYEVSNQGAMRSLSFLQRYLLRDGREAFRRTAAKPLCVQKQNSGYLLVHLHFNNRRKAKTIHRLVASAFLPGPAAREVNHLNGIKTDNRAENLEWVTSSENKQHAVRMGLNPKAVRVRDPASGKEYLTLSEACAACKKSRRTIRRDFEVLP